MKNYVTLLPFRFVRKPECKQIPSEFGMKFIYVIQLVKIVEFLVMNKLWAF